MLEQFILTKHNDQVKRLVDNNVVEVITQIDRLVRLVDEIKDPESLQLFAKFRQKCDQGTAPISTRSPRNSSDVQERCNPLSSWLDNNDVLAGRLSFLAGMARSLAGRLGVLTGMGKSLAGLEESLAEMVGLSARNGGVTPRAEDASGRGGGVSSRDGDASGRAAAFSGRDGEVAGRDGEVAGRDG